MKYVIVSLFIAAVVCMGVNMAYAKTAACACSSCKCAPCECK